MKYKRNRPYRLLSYKPIEEADNLIIIGLFDFERKTRLELATPTLARLCSTN